jgi:hypothetical protein
MILFIIVAAVLYVLYSTPHLVPGHRYFVERRAVTGTGPVQAPSGGGQPQGTMGEGGQTAPGGSPEDTE